MTHETETRQQTRYEKRRRSLSYRAHRQSPSRHGMPWVLAAIAQPGVRGPEDSARWIPGDDSLACWPILELKLAFHRGPAVQASSRLSECHPRRSPPIPPNISDIMRPV